MVRDADLQSTLFNNELMMTANCDDDCYISHKKEVWSRGLHPSSSEPQPTDAGLSSSCKEFFNSSRNIPQRQISLSEEPHHPVEIIEREKKKKKQKTTHQAASQPSQITRPIASPTCTNSCQKLCAFRTEHDWLRMSLSTILKRDLWLYMAKRALALGSACLESEMTEQVTDQRFPPYCHRCHPNGVVIGKSPSISDQIHFTVKLLMNAFAIVHYQTTFRR